MRRTKALVAASVLGIILVIIAGAVVRASGSGLGCPHWPDCFEESFFPPLTADGIPSHYDPEKVNLQKTWTEWINRLIGAVAGLVILAATISAWWELRARMALVWLITSAGFLTAFQGWLGAKVVEYELDPRFVTVHLLLALLILFMLTAAWLRLRAEGSGIEAHHGGLVAAKTWTRAILSLGLLQFLVGALVRGTLDLIAEEQPDLPRSEWIHEAGVIELAHRGLGFALAAGVIFLSLRLRALESSSRLFNRCLVGANAMVLLQLAAGLALLEWDLPPVVQGLHIVGSSLLLAMLFCQDHLLGLPQQPKTLRTEL